MAFRNANMFDLLDDENEDPSQGVAATKAPVEAKKPAKMPEKPAAPGGRGDGGRGGRGGRGGGRQFASREFEGEVVGTEGGGRGYGGRGGRGDRGGRGRGRGRGDGDRNDGEEGGRRPRREYDRRDGTGRGHEGPRRGGAGKGNWGEPGSEANDKPKNEGEDTEAKAEAENGEVKAEEQEEEPDNEMTLEDYEKLKAEKKKALQEKWAETQKEAKEHKIDENAFKGMKLRAKEDDVDEETDSWLLGNNTKNRTTAKKGATKTISAIETGFKTAPTYEPDDRGFGGRGRGRGRGDRDGGRGGRGGRGYRDDSYGGGRGGGRGFNAPKIDDDSAFPTLGGK